MPTKKPTSKKSKSLISQRTSTSLDIIAQLNDLAHAGTKESMDKLTDFIIKEKNEKLRGYANCALEEAEYMYYSPFSPKEEKEFLLAKMIHENEEHLWKSMAKADNARLELDRLDLDKKIHSKIMKSKNSNKREDWQYRFSEDFRTMVEGRLQELDDEIFYTGAWLEQAKKMITLEKYKNIPDYVIEHIHLDAEAESFWPEDYYDDVDDKKTRNDYNKRDFIDEVPMDEIPMDEESLASAEVDASFEEPPF
ncbi:hypothetical protein KKD19_04020 [Patescibacteria group bacterium]|nr:hypothetical protein [Patescibacteria group bacterium]MBU4512373.1 hypothetical protein [Patescibacteria group bacterium]